ncbi:MAG: hypothetical protein ACOX8S_00875 [Christensenellales bacterium]|jgi:putative aldouronate transport system substrate-binding protein
MMRKISAIFALLLALAMIAGCAGAPSATGTPAGATTATAPQTGVPQSAAPETQEPPADPYEKELTYKAVVRTVQTTVPVSNNLFDEMIKEKLNMVWDTEYVTAEFEQKMRLQFATNDYPEVIVNIGTNLANELALTGKLEPLDNHLDALPDYLAIWGDVDGGFDYIKEMNGMGDGHLYLQISKRPRKATETWIYRMGTLSTIGITDMPNNVDGLVSLLYQIKESFPDSYPLGTRRGNNPYNGFHLAYGFQTERYIDPYTDELVPYGAVTDGYREVMKLFRQFYADGIISKEFATMTDTQWYDNYTNGLHYVEYTSGIRANGMNQYMANTFPDAGFEYSLETVAADPQRGWLYNAEPPYFGTGTALASTLDEERMGRMLDFMNWIAGEEGSWFLSWGVEGITYDMDASGEPVRSPEFYSQANPASPAVDQQLVYSQDVIPNRVMSAVISVSGDTNIRLSEAFSSNPNYRYFKTIPWTFEPDTQSEMNLLGSALKEVQEEYMMLFIMGSSDPANDAEWDKYLAAMERAGLARWSEISQAYYDEYNK